MDKSTALRTLNLPENADQVSIQARYRERVTDLRQRISDAPAHLRPQFEEALSQADAAYRTLAGEMQTADWLPAANRVAAFEQPAGQATQSGGVPAFSFPAPAQSTPAPGIMQRAGQWFFFGMIAALAGLVFFGFKSCEAEKELSLKMPLAEEAAKWRNSLSNGRFIIKNAGKEDFTIAQFTVFYEEGGLLKKYEKIQQALKVKVKDQVSFDEMEGTALIFPGKALFYSLSVYNDNHEFQVFTDTIHANRTLLLIPTYPPFSK